MLKSYLRSRLLFPGCDTACYHHHLRLRKDLANRAQPVLIGLRITVDERDDVVLCFGEAAITCRGKARALFTHMAHRKLRGELGIAMAR